MKKIHKIVNFCENNKKYLLLLTCLFFINLFVIYFVSKERYFYYWDFRAYYLQWQLISDLFRNQPLEALGVLLHSIRNEEYNLLMGFLLMPFNLLFGDQRIVYILSIVNLFAVPSVLSFALLMTRIAPADDQGKRFAALFIAALTVMFFPQFWSPVLYAFPTVGGVLIINLIIILYFKKPVEEQKFLNLVLIGFLLSFVIIFKRWYAFWVVSFFISLAIERIVFLFPKYKFKIKSYLPSFKNIFFIGITSLILFFLIAAPIAKKMLLTDYADIYSAYKNKFYSGSMVQTLRENYYYFGFFFTLFGVFGFIKGIVDKETRRLFFFLFAQLAITFLIFTHSHPLSSHNYYILMPTILIFIAYFIVKIYFYIKTNIMKSIFICAYILTIVVNFTVVFIPGVSDHIGKFSRFFPYLRQYPLIRNDIDEVNKLVNVLAGLSDNVYTLSSSNVLNDDLLRSACASKKLSFCDNILNSHHVDKRDGFPTQFLTAKYVVVADPVQYHLRPEDQRVIGLLADQIINRKGIGLLYKQLSYRFYLDPNINVYIYERVKPFKKADLDNLSQLFINYYPDRETLFRINVTNFCEVYEKPSGDIVKPIKVNYENKVKLMGIAVNKLSRNQLKVSCYWQLLDELGSYNTVFVHFTNTDDKILFQNDHAFCQKQSFKELKGKFAKETYVVSIPQSAVGKEVYVKIGIYDPKLGGRLKIESAGSVPLDDGDTRAIVGKINL